MKHRGYKIQMKSILFSALLLAAVFCFLFGATSNASADWSAALRYSPSSAYIGDTVSFSCTVTNTGSSSIDFSSTTFNIDWGNTETSRTLSGTKSVSPGGSTTLTTSFTVPQVSEGTYVMKVTLAGEATGDWLTSTMVYSCNLAVTEVPPLYVSIQADVTSGTSPFTTDFTSSISGGVAPYAYSWTFGDGSTSSYANPSHEYSTAGSYTAKLIVTDSRYQSASDSTTITVSAANILDLGGSSGSGMLLLSIIGLIVVIIAVVIAVVLMRKRSIPPSVNPPVIPSAQSSQPVLQQVDTPQSIASSSEYCIHCGKSISPGAAFCPNCGQKPK